MKRFIQAYPEYQKLSSHVNKHISLLEELSHVVGARNLLDVSEIEQNIVCQNDHSDSARVLLFFYSFFFLLFYFIVYYLNS